MWIEEVSRLTRETKEPWFELADRHSWTLEWGGTESEKQKTSWENITSDPFAAPAAAPFLPRPASSSSRTSCDSVFKLLFQHHTELAKYADTKLHRSSYQRHSAPPRIVSSISLLYHNPSFIPQSRHRHSWIASIFPDSLLGSPDRAMCSRWCKERLHGGRRALASASKINPDHRNRSYYPARPLEDGRWLSSHL